MLVYMMSFVEFCVLFIPHVMGHLSSSSAFDSAVQGRFEDHLGTLWQYPDEAGLVVVFTLQLCHNAISTQCLSDIGTMIMTGTLLIPLGKWTSTSFDVPRFKGSAYCPGTFWYVPRNWCNWEPNQHLGVSRPVVGNLGPREPQPCLISNYLCYSQLWLPGYLRCVQPIRKQAGLQLCGTRNAYPCSRP